MSVWARPRGRLGVIRLPSGVHLVQQLCSFVVSLSNRSLLERDIENETTQGTVARGKFLNALVPYAILILVGE